MANIEDGSIIFVLLCAKRQHPHFLQRYTEEYSESGEELPLGPNFQQLLKCYYG